MNIPAWRDGRAVEGGGLENRCAQAPWVRILLPPPRGPDKRRFFGRDDREADGARLLSECGGYTPPRVQIPLSPPYEKACHLRERQAFFVCPNPGFIGENMPRPSSCMDVCRRPSVRGPRGVFTVFPRLARKDCSLQMHCALFFVPPFCTVAAQTGRAYGLAKAPGSPHAFLSDR